MTDKLAQNINNVLAEMFASSMGTNTSKRKEVNEKVSAWFTEISDMAKPLGGKAEKGTVFDGVTLEIAFPNGYGASIISHSCSYGGEAGLMELAVLKEGDITYNTPVTDDVLGWLTLEDAMDAVKAIASL